MTLLEWIRDDIVTRIEMLDETEFEDINTTGYWYSIYTDINREGSYYCSAFKARQFLAEYIHEIGDYEIDTHYDAMQQPEQYMVVIVITLGMRILDNFGTYMYEDKASLMGALNELSHYDLEEVV